MHAIGPGGSDRHRCYKRIKTGQKRPEPADLPEWSEVCGKCQTMLPCSFEAAGLQ